MKGGCSTTEDKVIIIQDIICLPPAPQGTQIIPKGEYQDTAADVATQIDRIYTTLETLISMVVEEHVIKNCNENKELKAECQNNITRLLTSEFLFYTLKPLTIQEFSQLLSNVVKLAASQPKNLHLILGSFAVRNSNDEIMSVVPHIQCDRKVKVDLIVKNCFADGDPVYKEKRNDETVKLKNAMIQIKEEDVGKKGKSEQLKCGKVTILSNECAFSFNNVIICKTAGGVKFFSCVDICIDHQRRIAKTRFENKLIKRLRSFKTPLVRKKALPLHCSHILISNTSNVLPSKFLVDRITHVDPFYSHQDCEENSEKPMRELSLPFGSIVKFYVTKPMICQLLQDDEIKNKIQQYNEGRNFSFLKKLRKGKKLQMNNALLQSSALCQSSSSADTSHSNNASEESHALLSPISIELKATKSTLEKEAALSKEEDITELHSSLLLQFHEREKAEEGTANTSTSREAILLNAGDESDFSSSSSLQTYKRGEDKEGIPDGYVPNEGVADKGP